MQRSQSHDLTTARSYYTVLALAFDSKSKRLTFVSDEGAIAVWDLVTRQELFSFGIGELERRGALPSHTGMSADGTWYAVGGARAVTVWEMADRKLLLTLPVERGGTWSVAWSPNRERLAVGTSDGGLVLWDLPKIGAQLAEIGLGW
jgi:WD40 repeat protein